MKNSKCKMNGLRYAAIIVLAIGCGTLFAAGAADTVTKMPAKTPAEGQALVAELVKLGPAGVKEVCGMLAEAGKTDDSKARFALHGVARHAMRPDAEAERQMVESAILEAIAGAPGPESKTFLIDQLRVVGKNASVAPLSGFLSDEVLCEPATQALLVVRTPDAAAALAKALPDAKGKNLVTVVRALGELREKSVARAILPHATADDTALRQTAWFALANIGDASAVDALAKAAESKGIYERGVGTRNYLLLATRLAEAGDKAACARICRALIAARTGPRESNVVCAGLSALAGALGAGALPDVLSAVDSKDSKIRDTALQLMEKMEGAEALNQLVTRLKGGAPETRVTIVRMLGRRGDKAALPAVLQALKDDDKAVRLAAIPAVSVLGGGEAVAPLLAVMGAGQGDEMQAAKEALMAIKGEGLTAAVGAAAAKASPAAKATLLEILGARGATDQVAVVLEAANDKEASVAMAALRALSAVVSAKEAPRLLDMLLAATDAGQRAELAKAALAACRKADNPAAPVLAALPNAKGEARAELLKVLARLGGDPALQAVLADAKSSDAALREAGLRALGDWCDASAAPALLSLARDAKETVQRVLALRGYVRLVALPNTRPVEQTVGMLKQAMAAAQSADDKKLVLGGLSNVRHADAATLAGTCLDDDAVKTEAAAAVITIICPTDDGGKALQGPGLTELLAKAAATAGSPALRKKAADCLPAAARAALPGEANLALNKPVKASVGPEGNNVPEKAVDGNTDNDAAWFGQKWPCWLEVDLQKPEKLEAVHVFFYHDGGRYYQYNVEVSADQKEYKKVVDMSKNTAPATADGVLSKFDPVEARFVRINILKHSANQAVHLAEIKVYAQGKQPKGGLLR
ncbi:MAG: HEAT repeat domain-containing protein [Planctomycetota bacterium]|nr:HEAT repeat domain-containing protein [Planctomycetota bacterium]